ncbi:MAG: hypothetical protein PHQ12_14465 [Chthoniobacteraceae bacterium]|nr:hypothetical protein [Chthoniobacteraceae bacterium]
MTPSDLSFEARYTAWMDGALPESERAAFEAECESRGLSPAQIEADRLQTLQLGGLLRRHAQATAAAPLPNPDFFNAQILRQIGAETPCPEPERSRETSLLWPLRRLIWSGAASLGAAALLFAALVFPALHRSGPPPEYYAQILKTADPAISAVAMRPKNENVTVLWIDGLDYVPAEKAKN